MVESKYRNKLAAREAQSAETPPVNADKPAKRKKSLSSQQYRANEAESLAFLRMRWQEFEMYWNSCPTLLPDPAKYFFSMPTQFVYTDEQAFFGDIEPMTPEMLRSFSGQMR